MPGTTFSILMPVYNNQSTIGEAIDSVLNQSFTSFEIVVVNDGSNDETEKIVRNYKDHRIKYFYQENADQLNALINCVNNSTGEIIFILHGDDCLYDTNTLLNAKNAFGSGLYDAIIGNIFLMDKNSNVYQKLKGFKNKNLRFLNAYLHLSLGNNVLNDFAFIKRDSFLFQTYNSYLIWNMPYWTNLLSNDGKPLLVRVEDFGVLKYRFDVLKGGNYINQSNGNLNVLNGVIRTFIFNSTYISLPFFNVQRLMFRLFKDSYRPIQLNKSSTRMPNLIHQAMRIYYPNYYENEFFYSILVFYENLKTGNNERVFRIDYPIKADDVFFGKNAKKFNKLLSEGNCHMVYNEIFKEMRNGFSKLLTITSNQVQIENILKFVCVYKHVDISYYDQ